MGRENKKNKNKKETRRWRRTERKERQRRPDSRDNRVNGVTPALEPGKQKKTASASLVGADAADAALLFLPGAVEPFTGAE